MLSAFRSVRFGNSVTIPGGLVDGRVPVVRELLLEANLIDLPEEDRYAPGSWVLTLITREIAGRPQDPDDPNPAAFVNPLKAVIHLGAGASTNFFEIDVGSGAVVPLPAAYVRVFLEWDPLPDAGAIINPWQIPDSVDVTGTLQRGNTSGLVRRSRLLRRSQGASVTIERIPSFARTVAVYGDLVDGPFGEFANFSLLESENVELLRLTGAELLALNLNGDRLAIPGAATLFRFGTFQLLSPARADFTLAL